MKMRKTFDPKQDIFDILGVSRDFTIEDNQTIDEIRINICNNLADEILLYFEEMINAIRKNAYGMSEQKYLGFNIACDSIIQQLNMSYIDKKYE